MPEFYQNNPVITILIAYVAIMSLISVIVCIYDKTVSKLDRVELRSPERNLMILSAFGGSVAMLITMLIIRHKTKHFSFMFGIPVMIIIQAAATFALFYFGVLQIV